MSMRSTTIAGFVLLAVAAVLLHVAGRSRRVDIAPLGDLVDAVRATPQGRLALVLAWAWLGWHFLAR